MEKYTQDTAGRLSELLSSHSLVPISQSLCLSLSGSSWRLLFLLMAAWRSVAYFFFLSRKKACATQDIENAV